MRTHKGEMKTMMAIFALLLMSTVVPLSRAQSLRPCWRRIANCVTDVDAEDLDECCPVMVRESNFNLECFCSIRANFEGNVTLTRSFNNFLRMCDIASSFTTLCFDIGAPSPASIPRPSRPPSSTTDSSFDTPSRTSNTNPPPWHNHDIAPDSNPYSSSPPRAYHPEPSPSEGKKLHIIVPAIVVPLVAITAAFVALGFFLRNRKHQRNLNKDDINVQAIDMPPTNRAPPNPPPPALLRPTNVEDNNPRNEFKTDFSTPESLRYEKRTIQAATDNFSNNNEIGRGGFGIVYKGILADGREIAVKRLSTISRQGDEEFKNEVLLLAKLQHKSLVRLMGYCLASNEKLLVYEYVSNKSLDYFLFDPNKSGELDWSRRYNIIRGVARGMLYLHEDSPEKIIHRDLKAANILLDSEMNPKVADFGLARVCSFEETHVDTSRIAGTLGYIAPEYMLQGHFSTRSDVYSFGMVMLEIISGKKVGDFYRSSSGNLNLLSYAWTCWLNGNPLALVDPTLGDSYPEGDVRKCIHLSLLCVQEDIAKRPSMVIIFQTLKTNTVAAETLPFPQTPSFMSDDSSQQMTTSFNTSLAPGSRN